MPWTERGKERIRKFVQTLAHVDPFVRETVSAADLCLVTTAQTKERVQQIQERPCMEYSEAGLSREEVEELSKAGSPPKSVLRFISMGRLLSWKGFHLGLKAFASANIESAEYWICGEGPQRVHLEQLARSLSIEKQVTFFGRLPRCEALEKLRQCHLLVHPSLHDSGGWVCLEAMASKRPVICLDWGGPGVQVEAGAGIKVVPGNEKETVRELANAMLWFSNNRRSIEMMGEKGLAHVRQNYIWESKAQFYTRKYQELLGE
jgi:glycosyltransferase involved in cell wall biosynthesis